MRWILLLLALAPLAQAAEPVTATVREEHYWVYGRTIDDIRRSIAERTPVRNGQSAFGGNTRITYQTTYRLVPVSSTACALTKAAVKVDALVTLPRLVPGTRTPAVVAEWLRYYAALRAHEYQHVSNGKASAKETQRWLARMKIGGPCRQARPRVRAAIETHIRMLDERDRQLDVVTDHGRSQGAWLDVRVR